MKSLSLLFLLLVTSHVFGATVPTRPYYAVAQFQEVDLSIPNRFFTTKEAACTYQGTALAEIYALQYATLTGNTCQVRFTVKSSGSVGQTEYSIYTKYGCPPNTIKPTGTITESSVCTIPSCPAGQAWSTTLSACVADCLPKKGQKQEFSVNGASMPSSVCMPDNCAASIFNSTVACMGTTCFGQADAIFTGNSCNGERSLASVTNPTNSNPPVDKPETKCVKSGQSYGTVNGVPVCVPKSSSGAAPVTTSGQSSTDTKNTDSSGNETSSGSTTKTNSTLEGGQVITKTETTKSDGTKEEETHTTTFDNFCSENPNHKLCKPQEEEQCEEGDERPQCLKLGTPASGDSIFTETKIVTYTPVQITSGGSCPPDKSVSIAGRSITFSYSWLCQYASMFKPFMIAFAYLSAAMFLFWGLKGAQT
jgi:hypothetical protein